ncbi:MAG: hypothetical protein KGL46_09095 [Hyphomicrobiales bacterium]|nr:hypothetical protein [Hyphomicrobiales bacterium]
MPFTKAMLSATLSVLGLIVYFIGGLLALLAASALWRNEASPVSPLASLAMAAGCLVIAYGLRVVARKVAESDVLD